MRDGWCPISTIPLAISSRWCARPMSCALAIATILIDTCRWLAAYIAQPKFPYAALRVEGNFRAIGLAFEDIDIVMCTHLHVDRAGLEHAAQNGRWVDSFPSARYLFRTDRVTSIGRQNISRAATARTVRSSPTVCCRSSSGPGTDCRRRTVELSDGSLARADLRPFGLAIWQFISRMSAGIWSSRAIIMHHPIQVREPDLASRCGDQSRSCDSHAAPLPPSLC